MKHTYYISGMTCNACATAVKDSLSVVNGVTEVVVNLAKAEAVIRHEKRLSLDIFKSVLPEKYAITKAVEKEFEMLDDSNKQQSKLEQLKPLLLIFLYLFAGVFLMHFKDWNTSEAMLDFMGLFYLVFSFFKFLDLKGFPESFRMYDPLAKVLPVYGWVYPFIEIALGLMFLLRFQIVTALFLTIFILGVTTIGVTKTLLDKKKIRCACLGTALKLPMTEATFIENTIMLLMAVAMLIRGNF